MKHWLWLVPPGLLALGAVLVVCDPGPHKPVELNSNPRLAAARPPTELSPAREKVLIIHQTTDEPTLAALRAGPRVLVFLTVPWSCPERLGRKAFLEAAQQLSRDHADLAIQYYMLDEDDSLCRRWASSLGIGHSQDFSLGAGSLIWLENGKVVGNTVSAGYERADGIIRTSLSLWDKATASD